MSHFADSRPRSVEGERSYQPVRTTGISNFRRARMGLSRPSQPQTPTSSPIPTSARTYRRPATFEELSSSHQKPITLLKETPVLRWGQNNSGVEEYKPKQRSDSISSSDSSLEEAIGVARPIESRAAPAKASKRPQAIRRPLDNYPSTESSENSIDIPTKIGEYPAEEPNFDAIGAGLKHSESHIKDAKRLMDRVINQAMETLPDSSTTTDVTKATPGSITLNLSITLPRLWTRDPNKRLGVTFTWLGLILTTFLTWYIMESITCEYFCHPTISRSPYWSPSDPFFPWAIPTKLDQWTGKFMSRILVYLGRTFQAVWRSFYPEDRKLPKKVRYY